MGEISFWYRPTRVVPDQRPLNGRCCCNSINDNNSFNSRNCTLTHTHIHVKRLFSGATRVSRYQKGKTNLYFTDARDSQWQWHQLGHMQVCTSLQTDNHASTPPLSFLQAGCPSCCPTNSVKALKAQNYTLIIIIIITTMFSVLSS